jgi:hypothetical protein
MEKRRAKRTRKRLPCVLHVGSSRHSGVVVDVSATGLFVQTSASSPPGTTGALELNLPGYPERFRLEVTVARTKAVPPRLRTVAQGGLGLKILQAPEEYYGYVDRLQPREEERAEKPAAAAARPKRKLTGLEKRARALALKRLGRLRDGG